MLKPILVSAAIAALLSACGGGTSDTIASTPPVAQSAASTTVQVNLGDAPADSLLAVGMTVNTVTLNKSGGGSVSVVATQQQIEMMQLMGTVSPLALASLPQGTYSGGTMTFGGANVTYVDATGQIVQKTLPGPMTANMTFNPPLTVGASPSVINFDMNMAASVSFDASGNILMTPSVTATLNPVVTGSNNPYYGGAYGMMGMVNGVNGSNFSLSASQGFNGTWMMTGSGTQYYGMSGMGMMGSSMLVSYNAFPQADGTWMVSRVQSMMGAGGAMSAGLITAITGTPPTQLTLVMRNGIGNGMMSSYVGGATTVNINSTTQFTIDNYNIDLTGLPFAPTFDRTHLSKGQAIDAWSGSQLGQGGGMGMGMGGMGWGTGGTTLSNSSTIRLEEQGLRGTVSGYSTTGSLTSFTLTFPADSAFARLSGATTVTVYQRSATQLTGLTAITNGSTLTVRGLLFNDGGTFKFIASRILAG